MGSCASVNKPRSGPPMKLVAFGSRADSLVIPESPMKENSVPANIPFADASAVEGDNGGATTKTPWSLSSAKKSLESAKKEKPVPGTTPTVTEDKDALPVKSRWSFSSSKKSFGSREETFFDSQAWLESDDEFHSVNGDFTPSRGNTPKHSFSERPPRGQSLSFQEKPLSPSLAPPVRRRKKLGELFRDSIREESGNVPEQSPESQSEASKRSGANSNVCSGELNTIEDSATKKKTKSLKSVHHCLPRFASCSSFSDKWKKMSSAPIAVK